MHQFICNLFLSRLCIRCFFLYFFTLQNFCFRLIKIKEWVDKNDPGAILIPFSGVFENKVIDMDEAERAKYFEESKVTRYE